MQFKIPPGSWYHPVPACWGATSLICLGQTLSLQGRAGLELGGGGDWLSLLPFSTAISWGLCQVNMQGLEEAVLKGEGGGRIRGVKQGDARGWVPAQGL